MTPQILALATPVAIAILALSVAVLVHRRNALAAAAQAASGAPSLTDLREITNARIAEVMEAARPSLDTLESVGQELSLANATPTTRLKDAIARVASAADAAHAPVEGDAKARVEKVRVELDKALERLVDIANGLTGQGQARR